MVLCFQTLGLLHAEYFHMLVQLLFYYHGLLANMFSISDIYKDNSSMLQTCGVVACSNHNRLVPFLCTVPKQFG